jgi:hypothetical protein
VRVTVVSSMVRPYWLGCIADGRDLGSGRLIVDCHGHYTTVPPVHRAFREAQLAGRDPEPARISEDEIREGIESNQLRVMRERGVELTVFSPQASAMEHHVPDRAVARAWASACNDLIARVVGLFPERFAGVCQLPQTPDGSARRLGRGAAPARGPPVRPLPDSAVRDPARRWCRSLPLGSLPRPGHAARAAADRRAARQCLLRHLRLPPPGIDLLHRVIPVENVLFASEMLGAVRGTNPATGSGWDDTKRYVDALGLSDEDARKVFALNARRVYPRLAQARGWPRYCKSWSRTSARSLRSRPC